MNPFCLTTAQLLLIHEWCDVAVKLSQEQARVAEKEKLWEMCAQLLQCTAESQALGKQIAAELLRRGVDLAKVTRESSH